jgi:hypothetical protein
MRNNDKLLLNGLFSPEVIPPEKKLQIVFQNESHVLIVMPCSSSVTDESGNVFRIEGPYDLNCNETRTFGYINKNSLSGEQINVVEIFQISQNHRKKEIFLFK